MIQLTINSTPIALNKGKYEETPQVVETRYDTEAGTVQRSITRTGKAKLSISMTADQTEKAFFDGCVNAASLSVSYWSETAAAVVNKTMFLDPSSYSASLVMENSAERFYSVSFTLEEF